MSRRSAHPKYTPSDLWPLFNAYLPAGVIAGFLAQQGRRFYQRVFSPVVSVWGFVFQRLNQDHTCDAFVSYLTSTRASPRTLTGPLSENNAAYCKARQRLPLEVARQVLAYTARALRANFGLQALWQGRPAFLLDGSTLRLKAEAALIAHYGRPKGRRGTSHWPVMRLVGAFDLWSGALQMVCEGQYGVSEVALAGQLLPQLPPGGVVVADQLFGIYRILQGLVAAHLEAVVRIPARHLGRWNQPPLRSGEDREVSWMPSRHDHLDPDLPAPAIAGRLLAVRVERTGFRPLDIYLFTTLTDRTQSPFAALVQLYGQRYQVEVDLRHVKTTLEMEALAGKSLDIVRKELYLGLTAYNLIRAWLAEAAQRSGCRPLDLSFVRGWRRIVETARTLAVIPPERRDRLGEAWIDELMARLATCRLPRRKQARFEPRAVRCKPQPYPLLKGSRETARQLLMAQWIES